jgi:hypothetical protein
LIHKVLSMIEKYSSPEETLSEIKHLMERSSRFISLSGFSGIFAGTYALLGGLAAYLYYFRHAGTLDLQNRIGGNTVEGQQHLLSFLLFDGAVVLILAVGTGIYLTTRKARKDGNSLFDSAAKKLLANLSIPLVTGGLFCLAIIYHGHWFYLMPAMLIFYGLALVHASKYTRDVVRSLGIAEICLGLASLVIVGYGLLFWSLGFGVLHIIYGAYMYNKYEK